MHCVKLQSINEQAATIQQIQRIAVTIEFQVALIMADTENCCDNRVPSCTNMEDLQRIGVTIEEVPYLLRTYKCISYAVAP